MKTKGNARVRQRLMLFRNALLLVVMGLLLFSRPAWAATQVRVVDADGSIANSSTAVEESTWSYDGKGTLTLNGFHGQEIGYEGGDLTIVLVGENTLEKTDEALSGGIFYYPFHEAPTERDIFIEGSGVLGMDNGITNKGGVFILGGNVVFNPDYSTLPSDAGCQYAVSAASLDVTKDGCLTINQGGISVGTLYVKDSTIEVEYTRASETPIAISGEVEFHNSFVTVLVADGTTTSVSSGKEIGLSYVTGSIGGGDKKHMKGSVTLVPEGFMALSDLDKDTPHLMDILWLYAMGITTGFKDGTYRSLDSVARCDMAAFLYRLAGSPAFTPSGEDIAYFADVDANTPHCNEIWWLAHEGISKGWDEEGGTHTFRPYASITRCDMAAFLYRLAGSPTYTPSAADKAYFSDVDAKTPHAVEVWWLASTGISMGWTESDGTHTFRPYNEIARCDMAAFLHRLKELGLS